MGRFFDALKARFGGKAGTFTASEPLSRELTLPEISRGCLVDYDLQTFEVTSHARADLGLGRSGDVWDLSSGAGKVRLLREETEDGDEVWSAAREIPVGMVSDIKDDIVKQDEPSGQVFFEDSPLWLSRQGAGMVRTEGSGEERGVVFWVFADASSEDRLRIERLSETAFKAYRIRRVQPYEFTNILPGA